MREEYPLAQPATEMTGTLRRRVQSERHRKIAALAFEFWLARAFRNGSPEADWLRADRELRRKMGTAPGRRTTGGLFLIPPRTKADTI
jgi:hypothetical protein